MFQKFRSGQKGTQQKNETLIFIHDLKFLIYSPLFQQYKHSGKGQENAIIYRGCALRFFYIKPDQDLSSKSGDVRL